MSTSPSKRDEATEPPAKSTVILLLVDIADTTWRMFVPPIVGGLLGWWADSTWHLFPWLTLVGLALGCVVTAVFIRNLLKKVKNVK